MPGAVWSLRGLTGPVREALAIVAVCATIGILINAVRPGGIPVMARGEYQILVPCPETMGEVEPMAAAEAMAASPRLLRIDARSREEFDRGHLPEAMHVPFDYLAPVPLETVRRIASSGARAVVVYGDGGDPDSGEQLAREISGKGIRNVRFVPGGAPALKALSGSGGGP